MSYIYQIFLSYAVQIALEELLCNQKTEYMKLSSDSVKQCFLGFHMQEIFTFHFLVIA